MATPSTHEESKSESAATPASPASTTPGPTAAVATLAPTPSAPVPRAPDAAGSAVAVLSAVGSTVSVSETAASIAAVVTAITSAATDGATTITTTADIAATSAVAATEATSMSAAAAETTTVSDAAAVFVHTTAPSVSHTQSALALAGASARQFSRISLRSPCSKTESLGWNGWWSCAISRHTLFRELSKIVGEDAGESWLRPLPTPRSTEAASLVAGTARFQREAIPLLQHYAEEGFARRVLAAPRHMNMVLRQFQELERVRLLHVAPSAVQLVELRAERDRLLHELGTQQAYWDSRLALADKVRRRQFKATMVEAETAHAMASSSKDVTIVALKRERDGLQAELKAAQDREAILRTRMANARLASPDHIGGTRGTRPSRDLHSVSLSKAKELLPAGVSWGNVRLDVREVIQFGASFDEAVARVQEDKTLHDEFRRRDLIHMLESMAYRGRMNSTLWVKRVPTYYLDQAVENLSKSALASPPKSPVPSGVISAASVGIAGVWDDNFSSLSSHGDSEDEDFAPKPQSERKRGASAVSPVPTRANKKAKPSPPQKRSPLAQKQYSDLTFAELDVIPTGRSPQNIGFPSYMPVKTHSKELKQRWDLDEYLALIQQRPWDTMFFQREKRLYFHRHSDLAPELQRQLRKYVDFMSMEARSFWWVQHWVTIDTGKDADPARLYRERKERRDQLTTAFETIKKVTGGTRGFRSSLWEEPGLWVPPSYCCHWIWRAPELSDADSPLQRQLKVVDKLEPARAQWHACHCDDFLPSVSASTRARLLSALERKSNLILG
ncbi:hypothetical protein BBJ28_00023743 [Nothophytophthora sp. Chile5]|nr:hypothetical protein BBJ28_00023743 [Nothophytophthora sp. Chile5]